jgi:DNA polymerase-3 subunit delta
MKLSYAQLAQHLNKPLAPIYLIHGDEPLLVEETMEAIYKAAQTVGFAERISITESGADWSKHLYTDTHSISLFAKKKIIYLNLNHIKLNAASGKVLEEYAHKPVLDTLVIIHSAKLDNKVEKSNWYKAIEKQGVVITIWPITPDQMPAWIMQRAKKINLTINKQDAEWLASQLEGHLLAASQEIEKLALLQPHGTLNNETIQAAVTDNARFDIFSLVDSALLGKTNRTLRILQNLTDEDIEPTLVLWALTRELRTLTELQKKIAEGHSLTSLFTSFRIWEKRQPNVKAALQRHKQSDFWDLLIHAAKIDRIIKGAEIGNIWDELQILAIKLSNKNSSLPERFLRE